MEDKCINIRRAHIRTQAFGVLHKQGLCIQQPTNLRGPLAVKIAERNVYKNSPKIIILCVDMWIKVKNHKNLEVEV